MKNFKQIKDKKKKIEDVNDFTHETLKMIEAVFLKENFNQGEFLQKYYIPKDNRQMIESQLKLVERVDENIMYEIIDRFKYFVASLQIIETIDTTFNSCFANLMTIRENNKRELKAVIKYNRGIIRKTKRVQNLKMYFFKINKIQEMKNMFKTINSQL